MTVIDSPVLSLSKIDVEAAIVRINCDRPIDQLDGGLAFRPLVRHDAEQVQCMGVIRLHRQDATADLLGHVEPASLVMGKGDREGFGDRGHVLANLL